MSRTIELTQGQVAIVDDEDYEWLSQWKWYAHWERVRFCARRNQRVGDKRVVIRMSRAIMNAPDDLEVDHESGIALDNRRINLRVCVHQQNACNQRKQARKTSSRFKGVYWNKQAARWQARVGKNGKTYTIGLFFSEEEAALAYNKAAIQFHGEFARPNMVNSRRESR